MKDLTRVREYYSRTARVDFLAKSRLFTNYDAFANPPEFRGTTLPYAGEVELAVVVLLEPSTPNHDLNRCTIAPNDEEYHYSSRISLLAKASDALSALGYETEAWGEFKGMIELCKLHSTPFGHPLIRAGDDYRMQTVQELFFAGLKALLRDIRGRTQPAEMFEYPFDDEDVLVVLAKDNTKIGGYTRGSTGKNGMEVYLELADMIYDRENGNVIVVGNITKDDVSYIIPAFGRNFVTIGR